MNSSQDAREIVMSYLKALGSQEYDSARKWLGDNVLVKGPAGEAFRNPDEFISMMQKQRGRYEIKKTFVDGDDVCVLYNFLTKTVTTFFSSWYRVKGGKIVSIQTVFDPRPFATRQDVRSFTPYLLFNGNCAEAMSFYNSIFGGELSLTNVSDSPAKDQMPKEMHEKIIYARLKSGIVDISASDWLRPDRVPKQGNTVCLFISSGSYADLRTYFEKLSVGASAVDVLSRQFFGTYGALTDKYGVRWMFQGDTPNP